MGTRQYLLMISNVLLDLTKAEETGIGFLVLSVFVSLFFFSLSIFLTHFLSVFYKYVREIINFSNMEVGLRSGEAQNIRVVMIQAINLHFLSCSPRLLFPLLPLSPITSLISGQASHSEEECNRLLQWSSCHSPGFFSSFSCSLFPMLLTTWKSSLANHFLAFHWFHGEIWGSPSASARLITIIASNVCFGISHHSMHLLGR